MGGWDRSSVFDCRAGAGIGRIRGISSRIAEEETESRLEAAAQGMSRLTIFEHMTDGSRVAMCLM